MLSASQWTAQNRRLVCGTTGAQGPAGAPGAPGQPGKDGVSSGAIYYFGLNSNQIGSVGPTGYTSLTPPTNNGGTNSYYPQYNGLFTEVTGSTNLTLMGTFTSTPGLPSTIPAGFWTSNVSVYAGYPGSTGPTGFTGTNGTVESILTIIDPVAPATTVYTSKKVNFPPDNNQNDFTVIPMKVNTTTLANPTSSYFTVSFYGQMIAPLPPQSVFQFWSNGDNISDMITSLPNPAGATGPTGSAGTNGTNGATGPAGPQGPIPTGNPLTLGFYNASQQLTFAPGITTPDGGNSLSVTGTTFLSGPTQAQGILCTNLTATQNILRNALSIFTYMPLVFFNQRVGGIDNFRYPILSYTAGVTTVVPGGVTTISSCDAIWMAPNTTATLNFNNIGQIIVSNTYNVWWAGSGLGGTFSGNLISYSVNFVV